MSERRRVLVVVPGAFGARGGIARFNRHLIDALGRDGRLEVRALSLEGDAGESAPGNVRWRILGSKAGLAAAAIGEALRWRPVLVVSGLVGFAPLALALKFLTGARLWTATYGIEVWEPGDWLERQGLTRSDLVTAISRHSRERLLAWCPLAAERVALLSCAIELDRFRPGPRPQRLVERYASAGRKVLLTVGRLSAWERYKGQDRVIRLLPRIQAAVGPVLYLIVGDGDDRPRLEALARDVGVADALHFAGHVDGSELADHYRLADLFVMPSTGEGFGIVFLEAMACGCPALGGNRDGASDALANGELGRLVDPLDPEDVERGIIEALQAGRQWEKPVAGVERFAVERFREGVMALVDEHLEHKAPGTPSA